MTPKWQKLASLAQEICKLWFQLFGAVFASKGYPFKNILYFDQTLCHKVFSDIVRSVYPGIYHFIYEGMFSRSRIFYENNMILWYNQIQPKMVW